MKHPYILAPGQPQQASVPLVKVIYKNKTNRTSPIFALVDSGAAVSFAPLDLAIWLGVKVNSKKALGIRGFNNIETKCFPGTVTVEVDGNDYDLTIYFGGTPRMQCILGQDPFFDMTKITFERYDDSFTIVKK